MRINVFVIFFYALLLAPASLFVYKMVTFHDVKNWPSTEATILGRGGDVVSGKRQNSYGQTSTISSDSTNVKFSYKVEGVTYKSILATPNMHPSVGFYSKNRDRAYYHPKRHRIAVLYPIPYESDTLLMISVFAGILVVGHLYFTIRYRHL